MVTKAGVICSVFGLSWGFHLFMVSELVCLAMSVAEGTDVASYKHINAQYLKSKTVATLTLKMLRKMFYTSEKVLTILILDKMEFRYFILIKNVKLVKNS